MPSVNGNLIGTVIYTAEPTNPSIGDLTEPSYLEAWRATPWADDYGGKTLHQPVLEIAAAKTGNRYDMFAFLDWYNRIHVEPLHIDLGNVVSVQQREIFAWNAYFVPHTLNDVVPTNDEGLTLTEPGVTPLVFAPLEQKFWTLQISTEGPALVDASYLFDFDSIDYTVTVVGVRIVAWQWEVNWINPILETLQWNTDVIQAYDGSEQRIALREAPRVTWEFTFDTQDDQRRLLENVIYAWGARIWALPIWIDVEMLTVELTAGAVSVPVSTEGRDYHAGGLAIVIGDDGQYESFEIATVEIDHVTPSDPIVATWPVGSRLYPARTARLLDPRAFSRYHRNYVRGTARFQTIEEIDRPALAEDLYRGYPVMEREPNWRDAPDIDYQRKLATIDFGTGRDFVEDESNLAQPRQSFRWTMLHRDEADYFRQWIYARHGRQKGVWLPTWSDDLILADIVAASSINIDFVACGLVHFASADVHRRDIRIELFDGTILYRRVINPVVVDQTTERMTMNATFGQEIAPSQVMRISWMMFVRLDTDSIELTWRTASIAEAAIITIGPRNDF